MKNDERFLKEALSLAEKGRGLVSPNPMVGAVVVKGSRILGRGWHRAFGCPHAEIEALKTAGIRAKGAMLYVTLEPCAHRGKTPPCTEAIIAHGIREVVACMPDPNPLVSGKGFRLLEEHGIKVRVGLFAGEAERLNEPFLRFITGTRPYIILKWAETLDGKIAAPDGDSFWITSEEARAYARKERFFCDALCVGIGTVLRDDPSLDYEAPLFQTRKILLRRKNYRKVVLDTFLKTPPAARLWGDGTTPVLLYAGGDADDGGRFREKNCEIVRVARRGGMVDIGQVVADLHRRGIGILMVEGGSKVLTSFWGARLADRMMIFIGNKIMGGDGAISPLGGSFAGPVSRLTRLSRRTVKTFGDDLLIEGAICFPA